MKHATSRRPFVARARRSTRVSDADLDAALRRIDPTTGHGDRSTSPAADRVLAAVLETAREAAPAAHGTTTAASASPRTSPRRRWAATAVAVAAAAGVVVLVPTLTGTEQPAFASWTAQPTPLPAARSAQLQADCYADAGPVEEVGTPTGGLAEARGRFRYTLVGTTEGAVTCFEMTPPSGAADEDPDTLRTAASWLPAERLPQPPVDGTTVNFGGNVRDAAGSWTWAVGRVGARVHGVTLVDGEGQRVQATVDQGYFAAWWPGTGYGELTVLTTLADGTTTSRQVAVGAG